MSLLKIIAQLGGVVNSTPPPPPTDEPQTLLSAGFVAADETLLSAYAPETGIAFSAISGSPHIIGNALVTGASDTDAFFVSQINEIDYSLVLNLGSVNNANVIQILPRWQDANNHIIYTIGYGELGMGKTVRGTYAGVGTNVAVSAANAKFELVVKGYDYIVKINDVTVRTDTVTHTLGEQVRVGIWPNTELLDMAVTSIVPDTYSSPVVAADFWNEMYFQPETLQRQVVMVEPNAIEKTAVNDGVELLGTPVDFKGGANAPAQGYTGGKYTITTSGNTSHFLPVHPFGGVFKVISIDVNGINYTGSPTKVILGGMVTKDASNFTGYGYNIINGQGYVISKVAGSLTTTALGLRTAFSGVPSKIHFLAAPYNVQMFMEDGAGTLTFCGLLPRDFDYTLVSEQNAGLNASVFVESDATTASYALNSVTYGTFGTTAHANPRIVTYENGQPYILGDEVYITQNATGGGGIQSDDTSCWHDYVNAIYKYNFVTGVMTRIGTYTFTRPYLITDNASAQVHTGDGVSQLIFDRDTNEFITIAQNMTYVGSHHSFIGKTTAALLSGGTHIIPMYAVMPMTQGTLSHYDPSIVKISGTYYITLCSSPNPEAELYPTTRQTCYTSTDLLTFTDLWIDSASTESHEGSTITRVDNKYLSLAPRIGGATFRVLDLLTGAFIAEIPHPAPSNSATGHVAIFPVSRNGKTQYYMITHDGGTWAFQFGFNDFGNFVSVKVKPKLNFQEYN